MNRLLAHDGDKTPILREVIGRRAARKRFAVAARENPGRSSKLCPRVANRYNRCRHLADEILATKCAGYTPRAIAKKWQCWLQQIGLDACRDERK